MGVIRLQLELHPALHPELHRLLDAIHDDGARAERLRQLAATGLLWESLRLQAAAAARPHIEAPVLARELHAGQPPAPCDLLPGPLLPTEVPMQVPPEVPVEGVMPDEVFLREIADTIQHLPVLTEIIDTAHFRTAPKASPELQRQGTATRSRLLRMKEKGLFKNE